MDDKKVSKLISYWLRHASEKAGLVLNVYGWTSTSILIEALRAHGFYTDTLELKALATRSDKIRWEFSEDEALIRATHGHSVDVALDERRSALPPAKLYHGTPVSAVNSILQEGLRPMGRKAVHLAATPAAALAVGRRRGKAVLLEVDAKTMHGAGQSFYQTSEGVWLTDVVTPQHLSLTPWWRVDESTAKIFSDELTKELAPHHALALRKKHLRATWRYDGTDDVLFEDMDNGEHFTIHLTWRGAVEGDAVGSPGTELEFAL